MLRSSYFLILLALLGCTDQERQSSSPTRTLIDARGQEVKVPAHPRRVFADSATGFDLMVALLDREQIAGVVSTAIRYSPAVGSEAQWADLPKPNGFHASDILALNPDLVLVSDWRPPTVPALLQRQGIHTLRLSTPTTYPELLGLIRYSAQALDGVQRGEKLIEELNRRKEGLAANQDLAQVRVLSYGNYGAGGSCAGANTAYGLMIELAGMQNAAAEFGLVGNGPLDLEQMLRMNPDLLLLSEAEEGGHSPTLDWLLNQGAARQVRAVAEKRWVIMPVHLHSTCSHHIMDAAETLARETRALLNNL